MRTLLGIALLIAGCTDGNTVGKDTSYRRLIDGFTSESACTAQKTFTVCYQTLTLCPNGHVMMALDIDEQDGTYHLEDKMAVADFPTRTVEFDLRTASSPQLPGDNAWQLVTPTFTGCAQ